MFPWNRSFISLSIKAKAFIVLLRHFLQLNVAEFYLQLYRLILSPKNTSKLVVVSSTSVVENIAVLVYCC